MESLKAKRAGSTDILVGCVFVNCQGQPSIHRLRFSPRWKRRFQWFWFLDSGRKFFVLFLVCQSHRLKSEDSAWHEGAWNNNSDSGEWFTKSTHFTATDPDLHPWITLIHIHVCGGNLAHKKDIYIYIYSTKMSTIPKVQSDISNYSAEVCSQWSPWMTSKSSLSNVMHLLKADTDVWISVKMRLFENLFGNDKDLCYE